MAPEQATGSTLDARADIFSFGAMLYEMVPGQRAFAGTSTVETLSAVIRAQPKAPSAIVPGVPATLKAVRAHMRLTQVALAELLGVTWRRSRAGRRGSGESRSWP